MVILSVEYAAHAARDKHMQLQSPAIHKDKNEHHFQRAFSVFHSWTGAKGNEERFHFTSYHMALIRKVLQNFYAVSNKTKQIKKKWKLLAFSHALKMYALYTRRIYLWGLTKNVQQRKHFMIVTHTLNRNEINGFSFHEKKNKLCMYAVLHISIFDKIK